MIEMLEQLQAALGERNQLATSRTLSRRLLGSRSPAVIGVSGIVRAARARR